VRSLLLFSLMCLAAPVFAQDSSSQQTASTPEEAPPASTEVARAEAAILKSDWKTAEPILDAWLADHPADARALFDAGYVADAQNRNEDAAGFYRRAVEVNPKSFEAQISLGLLLARMDKPAEARPVLETATQLDASAVGDSAPSAKARAWRALARIDMAGGADKSVEKTDTAQASIDLLEALKLTPETPEDTLMAATLAELNGDTTGAETEYRKLLKTDPDSAPGSAGLAHLLIAQKKYSDAEPLLLNALKKAPDDPALTAQLAAVYVAEDKDDALPLLQGYHAKHPQDAAITRMLAPVLADAGEFAESDKLYLELLTANPKNADLLAGHGQNLIRLQRYPEAVKVFQDATAIDETNGEAWNGLAFSALQIHQPAVTIRALTMRSKYLPESATIYFLWATAYDTLHDKKQASAYYKRFLGSANGKFPDQEWQAKQRLAVLGKTP